MKYPLFKVHIKTKKALNEIRAVLESGFINEGVQVTMLEKKLKELLEVENLVLTNSGTSALTMALRIAGVEQGDEVITTAMTCIATNTPIINLGANIVWADINSNTGSIDPKDIKQKISSKTKAIMIVNWAGTPCDLDAIREIGLNFQIPIIQDAAHSFGAGWKNQSISNFVDFTCYSFQAIKHFSTGDGGGLVCSSKMHHLMAKKLKWFGYDRDILKDEKGEWKGQKWDADIADGEIGYKFNMNNIAAAVGLSQLPEIQGILKQHRNNAETYRSSFKDSVVIRPLEVPPNALSSFWVYTVLLNVDKEQRDLILSQLNSEGIEAGQVHLPNDTYSAFSKYSVELPETRKFSDRQISLPCGWWLNEKDCKFIAERLVDLTSEFIR